MIPARAITEKKLLLEPRPVKSLRRKSYPTQFAADTDAQAPALAALYNRHPEATQNLGCLFENPHVESSLPTSTLGGRPRFSQILATVLPAPHATCFRLMGATPKS